MPCLNDIGLSLDMQEVDVKDIELYDNYDIRHYAQYAKIYEPYTRRLLGTAMVDGGNIFNYESGISRVRKYPEIPFEAGIKPQLCSILDITDLDGLYYDTKPLLDSVITQIELSGLYYSL